MSLWLATVLEDFDLVAFWLDLAMPDAWMVDLHAGSIERVA
jgi:hypothetical protein